MFDFGNCCGFGCCWLLCVGGVCWWLFGVVVVG